MGTEKTIAWALPFRAGREHAVGFG